MNRLMVLARPHQFVFRCSDSVLISEPIMNRTFVGRPVTSVTTLSQNPISLKMPGGGGFESNRLVLTVGVPREGYRATSLFVENAAMASLSEVCMSNRRSNPVMRKTSATLGCSMANLISAFRLRAVIRTEPRAPTPPLSIRVTSAICKTISPVVSRACRVARTNATVSGPYVSLPRQRSTETFSLAAI
jgi:hypothetical protein